MMSVYRSAMVQVVRLEADLEKEKMEREKERLGRISVQKRARDHVVQENLLQGFTFRPIGTICSPFRDRRGTPRQPILVPAARGKIMFDRNVIQHAHFKELKDFSHVWVIFVFHENTNVDKQHGSGGVPPALIKPPRLGGKKVGCLSTRSPHRPNPIGLSVFEILEVGVDSITVSGIDLCDGTPVLDVKPYIPYDIVMMDDNKTTVELPMSVYSSMSGYQPKQTMRRLTVPSWIVDSDIQMNPVCFDTIALDTLIHMEKEKQFIHCRTAEEANELITQVLRQDIRGVHQGRGHLSSNETTTTTTTTTTLSTEASLVNEKKDEYMCRLDTMDIRFITTTAEIRVTSIAHLGAKNNSNHNKNHTSKR